MIELMAETFFAVGAQPTQGLSSVGAKAEGVYVADEGEAGDELHGWRELYGAEVISPPHQHKPRRSGPRRGVAGWQGCERRVETIYDKLLNPFRLGENGLTSLPGFQARLAAKVSLHDFCIWFNAQLGCDPWPLLICLSGSSSG